MFSDALSGMTIQRGVVCTPEGGNQSHPGAGSDVGRWHQVDRLWMMLLQMKKAMLQLENGCQGCGCAQEPGEIVCGIGVSAPMDRLHPTDQTKRET